MTVIINIICPLLSLVLLLFCSAFFASSETAYTSLTRIQIRQLVKDKKPGAKKIAVLKSDMDRLITTVLTGTNFVNTLASSIATAFAVHQFGSAYVTYATAIMTTLVIIFGEIIPKTIAGIKSVGIARRSANALTIIQKILWPIVWFFSELSRLIKFIESKSFNRNVPLVSKTELKTLIAVGENEGTLEQNEKRMLDRIFEFSDLHVHDILRHRSLVVSVSVHATLAELIYTSAASGYSRLPVYADTPETIIGVLH